MKNNVMKLVPALVLTAVIVMITALTAASQQKAERQDERQAYARDVITQYLNTIVEIDQNPSHEELYEVRYQLEKEILALLKEGDEEESIVIISQGFDVLNAKHAQGVPYTQAFVMHLSGLLEDL